MLTCGFVFLSMLHLLGHPKMRFGAVFTHIPTSIFQRCWRPLQPDLQARSQFSVVGSSWALHCVLCCFCPDTRSRYCELKGTPLRKALLRALLPFGATSVILSLTVLFSCMGNEALISNHEWFNWNCKDECSWAPGVSQPEKLQQVKVQKI